MTQQGIQLSKELTLEYVRQNNILKCNEDEIESQILKIANVSQIIYNSIQDNYHNFKIL